MPGDDWIKIDLHIHTLDDPKDKLDYSAHELLARARALGFHALAITLHDEVFDDAAIFAHARELGILLIPAAEMRIEGADVLLLNVSQHDVAGLRTFADLRALRAKLGDAIFSIAAHPFYVFGGSIGGRLLRELDCFDAIELCHFHKGIFNPNRRAARVAAKFNKPLIATSDAHQLLAFGQNYTLVERPHEMTPEGIIARLRSGNLRPVSPPARLSEIVSTFYFVFVQHPLRTTMHRRALASSRD